MSKARARPLPFVRFCIEVFGLEVSAAWRALLKVAIDGVEPGSLDGEEREMARRLFGDVDVIPPAARRTLVWRLGRGSGKTTLAAALGAWLAWTANVTSGPGMLSAVVVVGPSRPTARISVAVARELVRRSALEQHVEDDVAESFALRRPDGKVVTFVSVAASRGGRTLRGYDLVALILDESEFFTSNGDAGDDGYAVSDRDLLSAARPRLRGPAILISTPWPSENVTAELFEKNHGRPTMALAAIGDSLTMRPDDDVLRESVELELERDEDTARREFFCQPGSRNGTRFFEAQSIEAAVDKALQLPRQPGPGQTATAGGDFAFRSDSSALAIVHKAPTLIYVADLLELRPTQGFPLKPSEVVGTFAARLKTHAGLHYLMADGHYAESVTEHLHAHDLRFMAAPAGVNGIAETFVKTRAFLREGRLRIPEHSRLVAQLKSVQWRPNPGGSISIVLPRERSGGHGDLVSALVLAVWQQYGAMVPHVPRILNEREQEEARVNAALLARKASAVSGTSGARFDRAPARPGIRR